MTWFKMPLTAAEALEFWDAGKLVYTLELGGLGPSYEQCIHIAVFELIRKLKDVELPKTDEAINQFFREKLGEVDREQKLGLSGAQAGCITSFVYQVLTTPWPAVINDNNKTCSKCRHDRQIQVQNSWPGRSPSEIERMRR